MSATITRVSSKNQFKQFIDFPYHLYNKLLPANAWVAPLRMSVHETLDEKKNPYFSQGGKCHHFLATNNSGRIYGRFSVSWCPAYVDQWNHPASFFGYYEQIEDADLAKQIFSYARTYAATTFGATELLGPINLSTNYQIGMLMDNYDKPPYFEMLYNPPYYPTLFETDGKWEKAMDLYSYDYPTQTLMDEKVLRVTNLLKKRQNIEIRKVDFKNFAQESEIMRQIYNDAWSENWGFVPLSKAEWGFISKDMKKITHPDFLLMGTVNADPCGFCVVLPDLNVICKNIPTGRLLPTGLLKLLWGKRKIKRGRLLVLGIKKKYQHLGLGSLFYVEIHKSGVKNNYTGAELSWVLETNDKLIRSLDAVNAKKDRTYRLYKTVCRQ